MARYKTVITEAEVDVGLDAWSDEELASELAERGGSRHRELGEQLYLALAADDEDRIKDLSRLLVYELLGRIAP